MAKITMSDMYCTQCGRKNIPIPRNKGREREPGHLKNMYCLYCQKKTNMVEVREFGSGYTLEDFELEFKLHNFNKDGTRKLSWSDFRTHLNNNGGVLD
jgi:hypothetical protein